jgi:hypothetical protein
MTKNFRSVIAVFIGIALIGVGAKGAITSAYANGPKSGPGHVLIGVDASIWDSAVPLDPIAGIFPIGGGGQVNGDFTIAERNGIQIGLRAQKRFVGTLMAVPNNNNKIGVYEAMAGFSTSTRASWNYDWHVDLRNAHGVAAGTTLADYSVTLETDIATTTLFGLPLPLDLTFGGFVPGNTILYQSSQNPDFGNTEFDAGVPGAYAFTLVLTPTSFNGPPISVSIQVNVN